MGQHLRDRHPTWEVTMPPVARDTFTSQISISHDEECRLGVPQAEPDSQETVTGQKRLPTSPPGTPRRIRVVKTPRLGTNVGGKKLVPEQNSVSNADVFG
jgi:hypothetical protein